MASEYHFDEVEQQMHDDITEWRETGRVVQNKARIITMAESRLNWFDEFYERIEIKDPTFLESILKEMGT